MTIRASLGLLNVQFFPLYGIVDSDISAFSYNIVLMSNVEIMAFRIISVKRHAQHIFKICL
jgi:hypothetical protein